MIRKIITSLIFLPLVAFAEFDFTVEDIRVDGVQRVSAGKVFNAIGIDVGQHVDQQVVQQAIKRLYSTGLFRDISMGKEGDVLVIRVVERPSISKVVITGNESIDSDQMLKGLRQSGMSEGEVFRESILEVVRRELTRQYVSQGRYNVRVETEVIPAPRNRVELQISIEEGDVAKIAEIRIVGNKAFDDEVLEKLFQLKPTNWLSWYAADDLYSVQSLQGDIERLTSYYLNRGYINFRVTSSQVSVSPDREEVFVTINLNEGDVYTIKEIDIRGNLPVDKAELEPLIVARPGQRFSRNLLQVSSEFITKTLGAKGYFFSNVQEIPEIHEEDKTVSISFFVEPGQKVYVRRSNFQGNVQTEDEVLRRELRQPEGGLASNAVIELSQVRLERLGFFKGVNIETPTVPGTTDMIDLEYSVEEQPSGSISASLGFSQSSGLILGAELQQRNFLGTGNSVTLTAQHSDSTDSYRFGVTDPYFTYDGVSAGFDLFWRTTDYEEENISSYNADVYGATFTLGYPLSETMRVTYGLGYENTDILVGRFPAVEYVEFIAENNDSYDDLYEAFDKGDVYDNFDFRLTLGDSALNRGLFPTAGHSYSVSSEISIPGASDLNYYKIRIQGQKFFPLVWDWVFRASTYIGYGDGYGDTTDLPFYESFYSNQYVRGYEANSLGPKSTEHWRLNDINGDPIGGNLLTTARFEAIFPFPFVEDNRSIRSALFVDVGQVFDTNCETPDTDLTIQVPNDDNTITVIQPWRNYTDDACLEPDFGELRASAGIGVTWVTAIAPISFSLAKPINDGEDDETEVFQFNLGQTF